MVLRYIWHISIYRRVMSARRDFPWWEQVQEICMDKLGISGEDAAQGNNNIKVPDITIHNNGKNDSVEQYDSYEEYLAKLSEEDIYYAEPAYANGDDDTGEALELIKDYVDTMDFSDKEILEYTKDYELDNKLNNTDISEITEQDIEEIKEEFGNSEEVIRLECRFYVYERDYEKAKEKVKELINQYRNEENYVIYTDIIAQEAYEKEQNRESMPAEELYELNDSEVKKLVDRADKKREEAEKIREEYDEEQEEVQDHIDELLEQADQLYTAAIYIDVKRDINYIIAKKPAGGDDTGIYDLQLAKLYLVEGDRDTAGKYLYEVIDHSVDISDESAIKEALEEVVSQYNQITNDEYNAELNAAIANLIQTQSNNVVRLSESTINGSFNSYVANSLKYDKINIHISKTDIENYPTIRAYININGNKDGNSELAGDFEKKDFTIIDTRYEISDFEILKDEDSNRVSIAIVMDHSGSMNGAPLANAKAAAVEAVNHMDAATQKLAIISYDDSATVMKSLSGKGETLKRAVNSINYGGGTNISSGLVAGIGEIKDEKGSRAIILMSDGRDGGSASSMEEAVATAVREGICVYTVAFGDCDEEYMKSIAEATGGKYMKASDSADLSDIYLTLQRYIVNNYCIEYDIEKNVETDPRYLTVGINAYNTSKAKEYYIDEENKPEEGEDGEKVEN